MTPQVPADWNVYFYPWLQHQNTTLCLCLLLRGEKALFKGKRNWWNAASFHVAKVINPVAGGRLFYIQQLPGPVQTREAIRVSLRTWTCHFLPSPLFLSFCYEVHRTVLAVESCSMTGSSHLPNGTLTLSAKEPPHILNESVIVRATSELEAEIPGNLLEMYILGGSSQAYWTRKSQEQA